MHHSHQKQKNIPLRFFSRKLHVYYATTMAFLSATHTVIKKRSFNGCSVYSSHLDFSFVLICLFAEDRTNDNNQQMEFKTNQWFGATVRSEGEHILVSWGYHGSLSTLLNVESRVALRRSEVKLKVIFVCLFVWWVFFRLF